jgi:transcriptional regulator with XRE-family HTH domain
MSTTAQKTFGSILRDLRAKKNLGQGELAKKIGVPQSRVCEWEYDRGMPKWSTLIRLAAVFEVPLDIFATPIGNSYIKKNKTRKENSD